MLVAVKTASSYSDFSKFAQQVIQLLQPIVNLLHRSDESTGSNFGCMLRCEFSPHSFSQSSSDGTVTSACFE